MKASEVDGELLARGFDMFTAVDRLRYINWGYQHVARKSAWYWERTLYQKGLTVGEYRFNLTDIPNMRAVQAIYIAAPLNYRQKLKPLRSADFERKWLSSDLTAVGRATPAAYAVWNNQVWVLPPVDQSYTLDIYHYLRPTVLTTLDQSFITPDYLDEGIVLASLIRCHRRAKEINEARDLEMELESLFDDMRVDENEQDIEVQERVLPDNTWL